MKEAFVVYMDEDPVIFTEDGRVAVVDAIRMVLDSGSAPGVWDRMKTDHPDLMAHCEEYFFKGPGHGPCNR